MRKQKTEFVSGERFLYGPRRMAFTINTVFDVTNMEVVKRGGKPDIQYVSAVEPIQTSSGSMLRLTLSYDPTREDVCEPLTQINIPGTPLRGSMFIFRNEVWAWATRSSGSDGQRAGWGTYKAGVGRTIIAIYRVAIKGESSLLKAPNVLP